MAAQRGAVRIPKPMSHLLLRDDEVPDRFRSVLACKILEKRGRKKQKHKQKNGQESAHYPRKSVYIYMQARVARTEFEEGDAETKSQGRPSNRLCRFGISV